MEQVRKIKPTRRSVSGHIAFKGEPIPFESTLERDFLIFQTFRSEVLDICAQPISIPFTKNGRSYEYTPDFFVQVGLAFGKSFIAEIKPKSEWQANWREWSDKWKATIAYCKEYEYRFVIYDEDRIRHIALDNIKFLGKYKNMYVSKEDINAILSDIENRGVTTIEFLLERYFKADMHREQGRRIIWHMLANKMIECNLWKSMQCEQNEVWIP